MKKAMLVFVGSIVLSLGISATALAQSFIYSCPNLSGPVDNWQLVSDANNPDFKWKVVADAWASKVHIGHVDWTRFQAKNTNQGYTIFCHGRYGQRQQVHAKLVGLIGKCVPYTNGKFVCSDETLTHLP